MTHNHNISNAASLLQKWHGMQSTKRNALLRLVEDSKEIIALRHERLQANSLSLIESAKPRIATIEKERHTTASYFNVFSALGVVRKEVIQSRFLAYLLSPKEHHDQCCKFLDALLQKLNIQMSNMDRARVVAERTGAEHGRMDIVIDCKPWLIVIEIKIDAGEGAEQLHRYRTWLDQQPGYDKDKKRLIFLTPTGHESITGTEGAYQPLSYSDIADAFLPLLENQAALPPSVREVLQQYISICRLIRGENMTMQDKELQALITNPDNLRAALEMEQQTALARKGIAKQFSENIVTIIRGYLDSEKNISSVWCVTLKPGIDENSIIIHTKSKDNYRLVAEKITSKATGALLAWYRPKKINLNDTVKVSEKMLSDEMKTTELSVGWRFMRDGYYIDLSKNEEIIECFEDNHNPEHQQAKQIADEIWHMFTAYRADIEALPSFQKAANQ